MGPGEGFHLRAREKNSGGPSSWKVHGHLLSPFLSPLRTRSCREIHSNVDNDLAGASQDAGGNGVMQRATKAAKGTCSIHQL